MRKYLWFFLVLVSLFLISGIVLVTLVEYTKTGRCYRTGSILSAEELRTRSIRNLLTAEMESSERENHYKTYVQTFLIGRSLTSDDVINSVITKSIVKLPKEIAYPLNTYSDVANVDSMFLQREFSIIRYGAGNVRVIPSKDVKAIEANVARNNLDDSVKRPLNLSFFERALGYGNYYFLVGGFWFIDLACCEDIYSKYPRDGKTPEWYARRIVDSIVTGKQPIRRYLVVSNCGDVLNREYGNDVRHLF